jgi:isopenicillin-N N-acyltransferase-like protein
MTVTIATSSAHDERTRGRELGRGLSCEISATWEAYARLFRVHGIGDETVRSVALRAMDAVEDWAPRQAEEVLAIAEGAGLADWQGAALNSRSEILTHSRLEYPGECSTVVYLPANLPPQTVQTWDWQHELAGVKLIWRYETSSGRRVKTFTEFGVLGKIGVNSAGLGLHFNLLQHRSDGAEGGVPVHMVARRLLDQASTVDDAREIVRSATVTASVALTVVTDAAGGSDARTFELSPAGVAELSPSPEGFLLHTNHFVDPVLAEGERLGTVDDDTYLRLAELQKRQQSFADRSFTERVGELVHHREDGAAICCHPEPDAIDGDRWSTHLVVGLDVKQFGLDFHDGSPCTASPDTIVHL